MNKDHACGSYTRIYGKHGELLYYSMYSERALYVGKVQLKRLGENGVLTPLSTSPAVHLDWRISVRIFEKIKMALRELAGGQGKIKNEKKLKKKIL
jgi:hypothetical protein